MGLFFTWRYANYSHLKSLRANPDAAFLFVLCIGFGLFENAGAVEVPPSSSINPLTGEPRKLQQKQLEELNLPKEEPMSK